MRGAIRAGSSGRFGGAGRQGAPESPQLGAGSAAGSSAVSGESALGGQRTPIRSAEHVLSFPFFLAAPAGLCVSTGPDKRRGGDRAPRATPSCRPGLRARVPILPARIWPRVCCPASCAPSHPEWKWLGALDPHVCCKALTLGRDLLVIYCVSVRPGQPFYTHLISCPFTDDPCTFLAGTGGGKSGLSLGWSF